MEKHGVGHLVTKTDLDELRKLISDGFKGVHDRQDITNGRVQKGEVDQARTDEAIKNLGREVFGRRRSDDRDPDAKPNGDDRSISQRDVRMVMVGVGGLTTIVGFFWKVLPFVLKALNP